MRRYVVGRLLQTLGVVLLVTTLTFALVHLAPGDPIAASLNGPRMTEAVRQQWRTAYGLDRPLPEQYVRWVANATRGELGYSFSQHRPVRDVFADALPRTMALSGFALILSFALGIVIGVLQAEKPFGVRDRWLGRALLLIYSVPDFWLALIVLLIFAYRIPLFPSGGMTDPVTYDYLTPREQFFDRVKHLALPLVTLTLLSAASVARYQRAALVSVLPSDWMRTALAKGVSWKNAVRRHAFRNAMLSTITLFGLSLPVFASGTVFVEKVFGWPGMGYVTVTAVAARDYPLVTSGVFLMSVVVALGAMLADLAVAYADPRVRLG